MSPDTMVFDIGNVFVRWDPRNYYRGVFNDDVKMEWFLANVCNYDWILSLDAGVTYEQGIRELREKFPEYASYIEQYPFGWERMFSGVIDGTVEILRELKAKRTPVYAITNWSHETFPRALELFPFLRLFDGAIVSGVERIVKPDPAIFRLLLDRYDRRAERCVFTDDLPKNVGAAEALGFYGHVFVGPEELRAYLRDIGLL